MYPLFDRVVELTVGETEITGLDIAFEIEKDLSPEPNPCHVDIYNLSLKNREMLSKQESVPVVLRAGYKNNVGIIFKGDLISCTHTKEGPTLKTTLASGDSVAAIQNARINKSFAKDTPVKKVIEEIARQLGLPSAGALRQFDGLLDKLPRGFSASGSAMDTLTVILKEFGYGVSVQSGELQIVGQRQL